MPKTIINKKISIINRKIDFYKIKINNDLFEYLLKESSQIYDKMSFIDLDLYTNFYGLVLFDKFCIVNFGTIGNTKHRFDIIDFDKNKVGNIIFAIKEYKSNISYLELSGLFCHSYFEYRHDFFKFLNINININGIVKKIDYKIDVVGKEVHQLLHFMKDKTFKGSEVEGLSAFDKKKVLDTKGIIKYGKVVTGLTIKGTYNDFKIYDKILDLLDNRLHRKIDGVNPYKEYLDSDLPISRIEVSKKGESFNFIQNNSIKWLEENIGSLFFDYLMHFFVVDFRKIVFEEIKTLNGKTNFIAKKQKELKLFHSLSMFKAYSNNLKILLGKNEFEKLLLNTFPEIQNKDILNYDSKIDLSDFFLGIE